MISAKLKAQVWGKTEGKCFYCQRAMNPFKDFTVDHVLARANGGADDIENLVPCCRRCNSSKGIRNMPAVWDGNTEIQDLLNMLQERRWKDAWIARAIGVNPVAVSRWHKGKTAPPEHDVVKKALLELLERP